MSDKKKSKSPPAEKPYSLHPLTFDEALAILMGKRPSIGDGHVEEPEPVERKRPERQKKQKPGS